MMFYHAVAAVAVAVAVVGAGTTDRTAGAAFSPIHCVVHPFRRGQQGLGVDLNHDDCTSATIPVPATFLGGGSTADGMHESRPTTCNAGTKSRRRLSRA
jgi:hypothetical protein